MEYYEANKHMQYLRLCLKKIHFLINLIPFIINVVLIIKIFN